MNTEQENKLKRLEELENSHKASNMNVDDFDFPLSNTAPNQAYIQPVNSNILDGYSVVILPENIAELYPDTWKFAKRCPTSKEVANFSTIDENDKIGMILAIQDLVKKCIVIFDIDKNRQISSTQILDAHQTFFALEIRDFYLPGEENMLNYLSICTMCNEPLNVPIISKKLIYKKQTEKFLSSIVDRKVILTFDDLDEPIEFLLPAIEITSRFFNFIVKAYRNNQNDDEKKDEKLNKIIHDKQFLLLAPYLYVSGSESVKQISIKFEKIKENDKLYIRYLEIINKLKLDNLDFVETECKCGSLEENKLRFPGGWRNMFINKSNSEGYY